MKSKIILLVLMTVLAISITGGAGGQYWNFVHAQSNTNLSCGDHVCKTGENPHFWLQYLQTHKSLLAELKISNSPISLNIYAPDGTCNIIGMINPDGTCSVGSMVVSAANFASLQTDPAIMAIPSSQMTTTQALPTTSFCQIANWIILNEDGYFVNIENETALVDPPACGGPVPVPEFSSLSMITLGIALASMAAMTTIKRFKA